MSTPILTALTERDGAALREQLAADVTFNSPVRSYHGRDDVAHLLELIGGLLADLRVTRLVDAPGETVAFVSAGAGERPLDGVLDERRDDSGADGGADAHAAPAGRSASGDRADGQGAGAGAATEQRLGQPAGPAQRARGRAEQQRETADREHVRHLVLHLLGDELRAEALVDRRQLVLVLGRVGLAAGDLRDPAERAGSGGTGSGGPKPGFGISASSVPSAHRVDRDVQATGLARHRHGIAADRGARRRRAARSTDGRRLVLLPAGTRVSMATWSASPVAVAPSASCAVDHVACLRRGRCSASAPRRARSRTPPRRPATWLGHAVEERVRGGLGRRQAAGSHVRRPPSSASGR